MAHLSPECGHLHCCRFVSHSSKHGGCKLKKIGVLVLLAAMPLTHVAAQSVPARTAAGAPYQVYGGPSLMRGDIGTSGYPVGWVGQFSLRASRFIGFDVLATGSYALSQDFPGNTNLHVLSFGPHLAFPTHIITPFIHVGLGYARWRPGTGIPAMHGLAKTGGLGFDIPLRRGFSYHLIQADYVNTPFNNGNYGVFSTGLAYNFGAR